MSWHFDAFITHFNAAQPELHATTIYQRIVFLVWKCTYVCVHEQLGQDFSIQVENVERIHGYLLHQLGVSTLQFAIVQTSMVHRTAWDPSRKIMDSPEQPRPSRPHSPYRPPGHGCRPWGHAHSLNFAVLAFQALLVNICQQVSYNPS